MSAAGAEASALPATVAVEALRSQEKQAAAVVYYQRVVEACERAVEGARLKLPKAEAFVVAAQADMANAEVELAAARARLEEARRGLVG